MREMDTFVKEKIRSPIVSGLFYPDEKIMVEAALCSYGLHSGVGGGAEAIIAPHGAWKLSGAIAGTAFAAAAGRIRDRNEGREITRVILLGPVHNASEPGLYLSDSDAFETPLGNIPVNRRLSEELASCSTLFEINDIPHLREHSLEVLLPFVSFFFPGADIIPILMSGSQPCLISVLGRALGVVFEPFLDSSLFVVSANLSLNENEDRSLSQAETCVRLLTEKNNREFVLGLYNGGISACGGSLIAAILESGILDKETAALVSGPLVKAEGDRGQTTYYGAIAFNPAPG
jgi:AmmeMemoRadiSam system protein B